MLGIAQILSPGSSHEDVGSCRIFDLVAGTDVVLKFILMSFLTEGILAGSIFSRAKLMRLSRSDKATASASPRKRVIILD